ncbi:MAG: hypothetical protein M3R30_10785, partial [Candidatus Eremiobacteraeota bacterium]|nr:hypothetical protein [Candidatus Eremiobacteraeota bacterium]
LSPSRRILLTPWMPAGVALAIAIVAPNLAWQAAHGWPMIELLQNGQHGKNVILTPLQFALADVVIFNPLLSLVWIAGLAFAFIRPTTRWIAWTFAITMVVMIVLHANYPADAFALVFATGAIAVELATRRAALLRPIVAAIAVLAGAALLPLATPILSEPHLVAYATAVSHVLSHQAEEHHKTPPIPSGLADMHGWPEMAAAVAGVYDGLTPTERATAGINAGNYGEASAINFFGPALGLPTASSGHNQYWIWGPHFHRGDVLIDVNGDESTLRRVCKSVTLATTFSNDWNMPYESDLPIYVCRGLNVDVAKIWPLVKNYN